MRIISQDFFNYPEAGMIIQVEDDQVIGRYLFWQREDLLLGQYKSNERAVEVFGDLSEALSIKKDDYRMPKE